MSLQPDAQGAFLQVPPAVPARALIGNLCGVGAMVTWAGAFMAADALLIHWPVLTLNAARFCLAVVILLALWALREGPGALRRAPWRPGLLIGGLTFGLGAIFLLIAQAMTDAVTVALIAASMPVWAALIEIVGKQRRLTLGFAIGLVAAVTGGIVATDPGKIAGDFGLGALLAVLACLLFALGSEGTVRKLPGTSPIGRTTLTLAGGALSALLSVVGAAAFGLTILPEAVDTTQLGLLVVYAVLGMAVSQMLWIASADRLGIGLASLHVNIAPFYVMLMTLAIGAAWSWPQALGAAIVAAGVIVAQRR